MRASEFLTEAAAPSTGRKYQHIEDLVFTNGSSGGIHAVERLASMNADIGTVELKWDGMPVVYWGRDENGVFRMIPKNAWAYLKAGKTQTSSGAPTLMNSAEDISKFVMGTGSADPADKGRQQFAKQFASLWPYFEQISPKSGFLEGGLLFYPGTKPTGETAMPIVNKETGTYDFQPNITTFHVPIDSELGKRIAKAKVMVAATGFYDTLGGSDESRYPNAEALSTPTVIVQGTTYVQEPPKMDTAGLSKIKKFIEKNAQLIDGFLAPKPGLSSPASILYKFYNTILRNPAAGKQFVQWAQSNLSAGQMEKILSDKKGLSAVLTAVDMITHEKLRLLDMLSQGTHGGIKQTKPEGYVQAHPGTAFSHDLPGQFIKAIDQANWSPKKV